MSRTKHNLHLFSGLRDGEVLCDPMCGGGGIPIEAAYEWPNAIVLAGDNHEQAYQRTVDNIRYNNEKILSKSDGLGSGSTSDCDDNDDVGQSSTSSSRVNSISPRAPLLISVSRWDVTSLPLRGESVDVFVTDLPFGKRSGTKMENRVLYPKILNEMARVAR